MAENRVTQVGIEVFDQPDTQAARITQVGLETFAQPDTTAIRATHVSLEVFVKPNPGQGGTIVMVIT